MARPRSTTPKIYRHKSGQAYVQIWSGGKRHSVYLGPHGSPEADRRYIEVCEAVTTGGTIPGTDLKCDAPAAPPKSGLTVAALCRLFLEFAETHYRRPDGSATGSIDNFRDAFAGLTPEYGEMPAAKFDRAGLKAVRERMIASGLARTTVSYRVGKIKRLFRWAAEEGHVPDSVPVSLALLSPIERGRTAARETAPVGPVAWEAVAATLQYLSTPVAGLVEFLWLTGCRPGEAVLLRPCDVDRSRPVWVYTPHRHKTIHLGKTRHVLIGPAAQKRFGGLLDTWAAVKPERYVFAPSDSDNATRKTHPHYSTRTLSHAVRKAAAKAGAPHWHPNQLRHSFATRVRAAAGLEAAQVLLGHSKADVTLIYAERDMALAERIAAKIG